MQPARPYRVLPAAPALLGALRKEIFSAIALGV
jgi:hypothetical protein